MKTFTKIFTTTLITAFINISCAQDRKDSPEWQRKDTIRVKGSEALFYPVREITNNYMKNDITTHISMEATGSTAGIMDLINGNADIALSTRKLTEQEKGEIQELGKKLKEIKIAKEVVVILTSNKNSVYKLSKKQLAEIFSGHTTVWDSVGGESEKIKVFIRPNNTGCYLGFKSMVLDKYNYDYADLALQCKSNSEVKNNLNKYPYGISFLGYGAIKQNANKGIKPIRIENVKGEFVSPTNENIVSGAYDLTRDCFIYLEEKNVQKYQRYLEFIKSNDSKVILQDSGFIYLNVID